MASWKRSSPELARAFQAALPDDPRVEPRQMFGYPCAFVGGNMFAGLHEERLVVRLAEDAREELRAIAGAKVFEPMKGRPMAQYTVVPPAMHGRLADLRRWLKRALDYGASLPAKAPKKAGAKKKTAAKKTAAKKTAAKKR